ncbi:MAG: Crp/Fnr family transcriptional regulator [Bacteriovoracia bacterium]
MENYKTITIQPGKALFNESDLPNALYIIKKGTLVIQKRTTGGKVDLAKIYEKEVVGELSFFDRQPRSASAIAITEVEAVEIPFESLDKIYKTVPPYIKTMITAVADRLRKANDTIRRLQKQSVAGQDGTPDKTGSLIPDEDSK